MTAMGCLLRTVAPAADSRAAREGKALDQRTRLDRFLADVERRAFRIARFSTRDPDEALDLVQDAMIKLVRHYADRPEDELRPLFYRILQNKVRDWHRRRAVRQRVMAWLPAGDTEDRPDPIAMAPDRATPGPDARLALDDSMTALEDAIGKLPRRQREAFMLRNLEGMDVAETATAMGCSPGSVKTHYSRAVHRLRAQLGEHWYD